MGVLQWCVLSLLILNIFLELITIVLEDKDIGMQIGGVQINNLHFAYNTALLAESPNELQVREKPWYKSKHQEDWDTTHEKSAQDFNIVIKNQNLKQSDMST